MIIIYHIIINKFKKMKITKFIGGIILSVFIFSNINTTFAINQSEIHGVINNTLWKLNPEKKEIILNKLSTSKLLEKELGGMYLNSYVYSNIKKHLFNEYGINKNENLLYFSYNRYSLLDSNLLNNKKDELRYFLIKELVENNIIDLSWDIQLYNINYTESNYSVFRNEQISFKDDLLDMYIDNLFNKEIDKLIKISPNSNVNMYYNYLLDNKIEWQIMSKIDLNNFKNSLIIRNENDFKKLFKLTSYRIRDTYSNDKQYRQFNIKTLYDTIPNNTFLLNPNQTFSFNKIYKTNDNGTKYKEGAAIIEQKEVTWIYGGGVCGAATGIYQGTLFNKWLEVAARNHSFWGWIYNANINWTYINIPWLDSTYFTDATDLKIKNITKYPIILINKVVDKKEYNFTLSMNYQSDDQIKILKFESKKDKCYTWTIWEKTKTSCYVQVSK